MNYKYINTILVLILMTLSSCRQDDEMLPHITNDAINLTATIGPEPTRVSQIGDNLYEFSPGDSICVVGWTGNSQACPQPWDTSERWWINSINVFNESKWTATPYMRWQNGEGIVHNFVSWWPTNLASATEDNLFSISHTASNAYNPDILVAKESLVRPANNSITLNFHHLLSRFDVHLQFTEDYKEISSIEVTANAVVDAILNLVEGTSTCGTTTATLPIIEKLATNGAYWSGSLIVIPQTMSNAHIGISFQADGTSYNLSYVHPSLNFTSGKFTTLTLIISKDKVKVAGVEISPWNDSTSLGDVDAEEI